MSKINKRITGLVEEPAGPRNAARVRVLSFKKGADFIKDEQQITDEFQPHGFVFVRNILERYPVGTLVDVPVAFNDAHPSNDHYVGDGYVAGGCRPTGYRYFEINANVMLNPSSISLVRLKSALVSEKLPKEFFVTFSQQVFGPFSYDGDAINSHAEVEVADFDSGLAVSSSGYHYFLRRPIGVRRIDAMTPDQLAVWLRQKLKVLTATTIEDLSAVLQEADFTGADRGRLIRCMVAIEHLQLGRDQLLQLSTTNPALLQQYQVAIDNANNEFVAPAIKEAEQIHLEIKYQQEILNNLNEQIAEAYAHQKTLQEDNSHLTSERERLIRDIRVSTLVGQQSDSRLVTYDLLSYATEGDYYSDYTAFIQYFCDSLNLCTPEETNSAFMAAGQLRDHQFILAPQTEMVLHLAVSIGMANVVLQHAEPDWIKFESFYENGLRYAIETALEAPAHFTFLVLQQCNLAAIECYAAPLLDLASGIGRRLPGAVSVLPSNLWLFFVPVQYDPDLPFGLPLIRSTYRKWGAFPRLTNLASPTAHKAKKLALEQMRTHTMPARPDFKAFFNDEAE